MVDGNSIFFQRKGKSKKKRILTITATFPSLIQPWLVNQLVQIEKNGGENRVLARRSEMNVYASNIDKYNLLKIYKVVDGDNRKLFIGFVKSLGNPRFFISTLRGITRYHRVFLSNKFTFREKIYSIFLTPYMGLQDVDLIHSHSEMAGNKLLPVVVALGKPLVITFHGLPPIGVKPISEKSRIRYVEMASVILVNTEFAKKQYIDLGADHDRIKVLPQGINLDEFYFHNIVYPKNNEIKILTVGRLHLDKGHRYSIHAVASLIKQGYKIKYTLVGSGPEKNAIEMLICELGIEDYVTFLAPMPQDMLKNIFYQSHIFLLPSVTASDLSLTETQGVVLQEAQASGLMTIGTKTGGIPECIDDGASGFLVEERSAGAIEEKLLEIIKSPDKWGAYQEAARKWVVERYDIECIGGKIDFVYDEVLANSTA